MTSHFDNLGELMYAVPHKNFPAETLKLVFAEAVKELDKVDPERITWQKWLDKGSIYARIYKAGRSSLLEAQAHFIDDCHTVLDHAGGHHLRCFSDEFLAVMDFIKEVRRRGFRYLDEWHYSPIGVSERKWKRIQKQYAGIMQSLKNHADEITVDEGIW